MQEEELFLENLKYKKIPLYKAVNFTRQEFSFFIDSLLEMGISKHVILQQLLENSILTEADLRQNYKTDDHTIDMIRDSAKIFSAQIILKNSNTG